MPQHSPCLWDGPSCTAHGALHSQAPSVSTCTGDRPWWSSNPASCSPSLPGAPDSCSSSAPGTFLAPAWPGLLHPWLHPHGLASCIPSSLPRKERACLWQRPALAARQGGVSQIREPVPNPACQVLQGSEQLIMNLIKGEQEPQSDLGFFSLTSSLCSDGLGTG